MATNSGSQFEMLEAWAQAMDAPADGALISRMYESPLRELVLFIARSLVGRQAVQAIQARRDKHPRQTIENNISSSDDPLGGTWKTFMSHRKLLTLLSQRAQRGDCQLSEIRTLSQTPLEVQTAILKALLDKERTRLETVTRIAKLFTPESNAVDFRPFTSTGPTQSALEGLKFEMPTRSKTSSASPIDQHVSHCISRLHINHINDNHQKTTEKHQSSKMLSTTNENLDRLGGSLEVTTSKAIARLRQATAHLETSRYLSEATAKLAGPTQNALRRDLSELRQDLLGYIETQIDRVSKTAELFTKQQVLGDQKEHIVPLHAQVAFALGLPRADAATTLRLLKGALISVRESGMRRGLSLQTSDEDCVEKINSIVQKNRQVQAEDWRMITRVMEREAAPTRQAHGFYTTGIRQAVAERHALVRGQVDL